MMIGRETTRRRSHKERKEETFFSCQSCSRSRWFHSRSSRSLWYHLARLTLAGLTVAGLLETLQEKWTYEKNELRPARVIPTRARLSIQYQRECNGTRDDTKESEMSESQTSENETSEGKNEISEMIVTCSYLWGNLGILWLFL